MNARLLVVPPLLNREAAQASTPERIKRARAAAAEARAAAPVVSGDYRDGIDVVVNGDDVEIVDTDPEAAFKEYGTVDTPAHAVLTRAARKLGTFQ